MRTIKSQSFSLTETRRRQFLNWAQQFDEAIWLDSNTYPQRYGNYSAILAVEALTSIKSDFYGAFDRLREYQNSTADWLFGYLSYDLKNDVENLKSQNYDGLGFPDLYFFQPKRLFLFSENQVEIQYMDSVADEMEKDWAAILSHSAPAQTHFNFDKVNIKPRTPKNIYIHKVEEMLRHISLGNIYEANLCQEYFSEETEINPMETFLRLNKISQAPFSTFLRLEHIFLLSASPERYLKRMGDTIISQPIKGTARRMDTAIEDRKMAQYLARDPKERSENIMIVDLVRNDLSRFAQKGSVQVNELCGVYTFEQVHQLISTISCRVAPELDSVEMLRQTFPMGSMTGAPKISAMKIIEEIEDAKRGLYSGAVGYFATNGDFDFNVVIRSILYNSASKYVSFSVGGAITINSRAEKEYEECLVKAAALRKVLGN